MRYLVLYLWSQWWRLYQRKACNVNFCRSFAAFPVPKVSWVTRIVPPIRYIRQKNQDAFQQAGSSPERVKLAWGECKKNAKEVLQKFSVFQEQGRNCSEQFLHWDNFLNQIFPVICDLTPSHRESYCELYLSAIHRALPLCFALDRVNYKHWLPLYYEDAVALKERFPNMHARFSTSDFTVKHRKKSASALQTSKGPIWCHRNNKKKISSPEMEHIEIYENEIH